MAFNNSAFETCTLLTCTVNLGHAMSCLGHAISLTPICIPDMTRMEMSALIMSPAPKLPSAKKAEETEAGSGDNSGSASDEEMNDEDLYDAAEKRSDVTGPVEKGKNKAS